MVARRLARALALFRRGAEWVTTALFFGIFVVFLAGVAARYGFSRPIAWGDELAMILFVWSTFLFDAFVSRDKDQVAFDALWVALPPQGRRILGLAQTLLFGLLFLVAFPAVLDYVLFLWRERTPALEWRLDLVYSCFVLYMACVVIRLAARFMDFAGPHWREHVADEAPTTANVIG